MKIKKEIKPFTMQCESKEEYCKVKSILEENDVPILCREGSNDISINAYFTLKGLVYTTFNKYFFTLESELTYSEFMKLYGDEEEEVFTREDMKDFAEYQLSNYSKVYVSEGYKYVYKGRENDWNNSFTIEELLTTFLSERTND